MKHQRGLSLIELIIFIVVVSIAVVGVLGVFNVTARASADPLVRKQSTTVAESMLNEILAKDFTAGGYSGTERGQFDDVSDYDGYMQTGIRAIDGSAVDGLESYQVSVSIDTAAALAVPAGAIKEVTVAVTGGGNTIALIGYRTNYE
jgi:MSHA pilin protein MshD